MYDPQLGRWHSIDLLAEYHQEYTPYNYVINNPLLYMDLFGLDTVNANSNQSVRKDDVILFDDGRTATSSCDEVKVTPKNQPYQGRSYFNTKFEEGTAWHRGVSGYELDAASGRNYSTPTSLTQKTIQNNTQLDCGLAKLTFESSHQTTISSTKTGVTLNTLVIDKFSTRQQIRYSSPNLTVNGFANGFDMRISLGKYSMSYGLQYGPNSIGYGLTNTIGYGINNGGIISCQTMKGESSLKTLLIPLGVVTGAYLPGLSPVLRTAY